MLTPRVLLRNNTGASRLVTSATAAASLAATALVLNREDEGGRTSGDNHDASGTTPIASEGVSRTVQPFLARIRPVDLLVGSPFHPSSGKGKNCSCESLMSGLGFGRQKTVFQLKKSSTKAPLESKYKVDWDNPLGEGGFGAVYMCTHRVTGANLALKMIPKQYTDQESFQREIDALLRVRDCGGHPNICKLKENFEERGNYYLVMDLISGGEMFNQLAMNGPYSEADAAHLVMETASALAFLHGVGLVHADLKPENLMLSTPDKRDSIIKLVDFGCSEDHEGGVDAREIRMNTSTTPAYSPPEAFRKHKGPLSPSFDMWAMGCILYIMLVGAHPFDIDGSATDEEMEERIKRAAPPLRNSPYTAHVSDSAIDLIEKLMTKNPRRRMTAMQMLDHPWVRGETAKTDKMAGSDEKLGSFRKFKSRLEAKVFSDWISGSSSDAAKKTSLIERAFASANDLSGSLKEDGWKPGDGFEDIPLSISGLSELISDHMVSKHYPAGHCIYKEGAKGDFIYFVNSGTVEVSTKSGFKTTLSQGQLFGEGALLDTKGGMGRRSATIKCLTPVHVIRISKEYFEKYMRSGSTEMNLTLREQDRARNRERALKVLHLQKNLVNLDLRRGDVLYSFGDGAKSMFIVEDGTIKMVDKGGKHLLDIHEGEMFGAHSLLTGSSRDTTALCASDECYLHELTAKDFLKLYNSSDNMKRSFQEFICKRLFQKAIAIKFGKDFDQSIDDLRRAFDVIDSNQTGDIDLENVKGFLKSLYPQLSDDSPMFALALQLLDIDGDKTVSWEEFKKVFT